MMGMDEETIWRGNIWRVFDGQVCIRIFRFRSDETFILRVGYCITRTYVVMLGAPMSQILGLARTSYATASSLFI